MILEQQNNKDKSSLFIDQQLQVAVQPKVIVAQVPDSSKFFANSSQVYEIQFIEIPMWVKEVTFIEASLLNLHLCFTF